MKQSRNRHPSAHPARNVCGVVNCSARCAGWGIWLIVVLLAAGRAGAQEEAVRIFEQEPFDLLVFKDGKQAKVELLPIRQRQLPAKPRSSEKLIVRMLDDSETEYETTWGDIDLQKTRLFEQLVLEEANKVVAEGRFNEAYEYFDYLQRYYPKLPGLEDSVQNYLYEEAKHYQRKAQYDESLALLNELHRRNPKRADLSQALGAATGKLVEQKVEAGDYSSARRLVRLLQQKFPQNPVAVAWIEQLSAKARESLVRGQADLAEGRYREAANAAREAMQVWPLDEAKALLTEAHQKFPRVVVAVTLPAANPEANPMIDWGARRSARLFNRRLLEFAGYGPQGGMYRCPVGELERQDLGMRMLFRLRPEIPWSDGIGVLTGHDVARRLLNMTQPDHPAFRPDWAELFQSVAVRDVYEVEVELRRSHVHPDGMLQTILTPWDAPADSLGRSIGPYVVDSGFGSDVSYLANQHYFATSPTQPREIVERYYPEQRKAIQALKNGEVAMVDRLVPWEIETVGASADVVVERYAVPTIHCLIPNFEQPILARRAFRRALLYGIQRENVLRTQLLRGAPQSLGQVVSGPFPRGETLDDPVGYAYNESVAPYPYDPHLALILVSLARQQLAIQQRKEQEKQSTAANGQEDSSQDTKLEAADLPPLPKLVLAHPPHDIARVACRAIKRQLELIKISVELKELQPQDASGSSGEWDLLYAELAMWEPVIDSRRLLGPQGLAGYCTPHMDLLLRQLEQAEDWKRVRDKLLEIHGQAAKDLTIIPLWQLTDHFAYNKNLQGVGKRPATLYQNIESWQAPPWFSAEAL